MYTIEELISIAESHGVNVSRRQVEEWSRQGLLPPPSRPGVPGRRGRGQKLHPDPAPDVVAWLGRWRRDIEGVDRVKIWLWLEGYDYLDIDPPLILRLWCIDQWADWQKRLPELPALADALVPEMQRDTLLDVFDERVTRPLIAAGCTQDAVQISIWSALATLGVLPPETWQILHERDADDVQRGVVGQTTMGMLGQEAIDTFDIPAAYRAEAIAILPTMADLAPLITLPHLAQAEVDWADIRSLWYRLGVITTTPVLDAPYAPMLPILQAVHRRCYQLDPLTLLIALAAAHTTEMFVGLRDLVHRWASSVQAEYIPAM